MTKIYRAIGLMSGTSMDGIDVAPIETDGENRIKRGNAMHLSYRRNFRARLVKGLEDARSITSRDQRPGILSALEWEVTRNHIEAVELLLKSRHLVKRDVSLIGFHGQTVLHRPENKLTVQLGKGEFLARQTGIRTVFDFRARDVEAGGEGAPLVPVYHQALAISARLPLPICVVNVGGVANVSWIGDGDELMAFDTGPGNALIDDWIWRHTGEPMDRDGRTAASGELSEKALSELMDHAYFAKAPPKSLDRSDFKLGPLEGLSLEDGAKTLTAFTAHAIARAVSHFPTPPKTWVISGGGVQNPTLMGEIKNCLEGEVKTADDLGWSSEFMEAEAFAYMAVRSHLGRPITFPRTTGVPHPLTGGKIVSPPAT